MSFTVVAIAEDPTNNGYILKPLLREMLAACGKPQARISVPSNPRTKGYEHAKKLVKTHFIESYRHADLLLFLPDADGKQRSPEFQSLEVAAVNAGTMLLCCAAIEEVETWLLAGHVDKLTVSWSEVRANRSVKEEIFQPFLREHGNAKLPGYGRELLMSDTVRNYQGLLVRCPELADLEYKIKEWITSRR